MWKFLTSGRQRQQNAAKRRVGPTLEPLEDRLLLSQGQNAVAPAATSQQGSSQQQEPATSIALGHGPVQQGPVRPGGPGQSPAQQMGAGRATPGGPAAGPGAAPPPSPPARPAVATVDPGGLNYAFGKISEPPAVPGHGAALAHQSAADLEDPFELIDISGELSFTDTDGQLTDREFAALLTNTRVRPDVVPQQGSAVASVATLVPSDRDEPVEAAKTNELATLLIDPLDRPQQNGGGSAADKSRGIAKPTKLQPDIESPHSAERGESQVSD
jgi:hypothetical protein